MYKRKTLQKCTEAASYKYNVLCVYTPHSYLSLTDATTTTAAALVNLLGTDF